MNKQILLTVIGLAFVAQGCGAFKKDHRSSSEPAAPTPAVSANDEGILGDAPAPADKAAGAEATLDGKGLYGKLCAACHAPLEQNDIGKTSLAAIQKAIIEVKDMNGLKATSEPDLTAIAEALNKISPGKGKGKKN